MLDDIRDLNLVNPARAGMILALLSMKLIQKGKPRASGDDPIPSGMSTVRPG